MLNIKNAKTGIYLLSFFAAKNLHKTYGNTIVLENISINLQHGNVLGLLGKNGAGKSTTLQILSGCLTANAGELHLDNIDFDDNPTEYKNNIGYLPDTPPLFKELRVIDYLRLIAKLRKIATAKIQTKLDFVIEACALKDVLDSAIKILSKGYQQRLGIAQAIIHQPKLLILDEPTVGLDPQQLALMRQLIQKLSKQSTIIFSSHILQEVEAVCDQICLLENGKILAQDSITNLQAIKSKFE